MVPFKSFTRAKRRLRSRWSDAEVEEILHALLFDVLTALGRAERVEQVAVLTDDDAVGELARETGASVRMIRPDPGLNPAIEAAAADFEAEGYDTLLVTLGDLPLLQGSDVDLVVEAGESHAVVIVPSTDGGTALLLRRPPRRIPASFGPKSAAAHEQAARSAGLEPRVLSSLDEIVRVDLDTPEDALRLLASGVRCRTRDVLARLCA